MNRINYNTFGELVENGGIFAKYNTLYSTDVQAIFGDDITTAEIVTIDNVMLDKYFDRTLKGFYQSMFDKPDVTKDSIIEMICKKCHILFNSQWIAIKNSIDKVLNTDVEKPFSSSTSTEQTIDGETGNINKVYGYDSENAVNDNSNSATEDKTIETTETKEYSGTIFITGNAEKQFNFVKYNNLLDMIFDDVINECCLDIY